MSGWSEEERKRLVRKRKAPRIRLPFWGAATVEGKTIEVQAKDLSATGVFLWAPAFPEIGDTVKVQLWDAKGASLNLKSGGVGTCVRVQKTDKGIQGFAVHFEEPSE